MRRRSVLIGLGGLVVTGAGASVCYQRSLYAPASGPGGRFALVGATVLAGPTLEPLPAATVVVADGRIVEAGPAAAIEPPPDVPLVDVTGLTVLPGLIDAHVHLGSPDLDARERPGPRALPRMVLDGMRFAPGHRRAALEHGVTAVRSLGDDHAWVRELRRQLRDGTLEGPRLIASGPLFTTPRGHPVATLGVDPGSDVVRLPATADEARTMVRDLAGGPDRVDLIKVVQDRGGPDRSLEPIASTVLTAIVAEAHAHGLKVTAHWGTLADLRDLLAAGVDGLEHIDSRDLLDGWPDGLLAELVERRLPLTATLAITEAALPPTVMPAAMRAFRRRVGEFHRAGGTIVLGTDAAQPGVHFGTGVHRELALLVDCGLTPRQALRAATADAARALGSDTIGAVSPGRAADLVVVRGNPLADVTACREIVLVYRDGRLVVDRREG